MKETKFALYDEDDPYVHRTMRVDQTWEESRHDTVMFEDRFDSKKTPDFFLSKTWFLRGVSLSRPGVVKKLKKLGVPEGWKESPLLRNCFPLALTADGCWEEDATVRLDDDLGVVYESKEAE